MIKLGIYLAERGLIPDFILNFFIQKISLGRVNSATNENEKLTVINQLKSGPIAEKTSDANDQHYEVPPEFFQLVLGRHMKYSCSHFDSELDDLNHAEESMLQLYLDRAGIQGNQKILDLGCGWGSFSLFAAAKFPTSKFTAVSNSRDQINFINAEAKKRGLKNLIAMQKNINEMSFNETFDKVISIEMFEHMRNYESLLSKVSNFLKPNGELFVHIFCHRFACYLYEAKNESDWMTKNFFEGGIMPSEDIFSNFENDLKVVRSWKVNGTHYGLTSQKWLEKHDKNKSKIIPLFNQHYGDGKIWFFRWRLFFLTCAKFFSINKGNDWYVTHYLLRK
jgi:cyclopropane-fatty-acyl-phospholipid synthase